MRPVYVALTAAMALFGSAFVASKALAAAVPPEAAAALRFGAGAIVLLAWLAATGRGFRLSARDWVRIGAGGALGVFAFNWLLFWGLHHSPSIDASVIVPVLSPVLTTASAAVFFHESISRMRIVGLTVGVFGAVVFLIAVDGGTNGERLLGDLACVAGAAVWSAYTLVGRRILRGIDPLTATTLTTSVGAVMLVAAAAPALQSVAWSRISTGLWLDIAYLGVGPTAVAYVLYFHGIRAIGPARASLMMLLIPIFGAAGGFIVRHERLSAAQLVGAALMLGGALLALWNGAARSTGRSRRASAPVAGRR